MVAEYQDFMSFSKATIERAKNFVGPAQKVKTNVAPVCLTDYSANAQKSKIEEPPKPFELKDNLFLLDDISKPTAIGPHMLDQLNQGMRFLDSNGQPKQEYVSRNFFV